MTRVPTNSNPLFHPWRRHSWVPRLAHHPIYRAGCLLVVFWPRAGLLQGYTPHGCLFLRVALCLEPEALYERDMAEATKNVHDAAKKIVIVIKDELDSSMTSNGAASTLTASRRLVLRGAGGCGSGKLKADGYEMVDQLAEKKFIMDGEAPNSRGGAARNNSYGAVQASSMSAPRKADLVDASVKSCKIPVDELSRALKAVDALDLKWSMRTQRAVLHGAAMERRAIAFLLAERVYAA